MLLKQAMEELVAATASAEHAQSCRQLQERDHLRRSLPGLLGSSITVGAVLGFVLGLVAAGLTVLGFGTAALRCAHPATATRR